MAEFLEIQKPFYQSLLMIKVGGMSVMLVHYWMRKESEVVLGTQDQSG